MSDEPLTQAQYDELGEAWSGGPFARYFGFRTTFLVGDKVIVELGDIHAGKLGGKGSDAINGAMLSALGKPRTFEQLKASLQERPLV